MLEINNIHGREAGLPAPFGGPCFADARRAGRSLDRGSGN
jgi:hypothetical protein